ncbi:xanthine dehydrogenase family protein molybdopterin-binding subunit [Bradyrhizobium guangdongense]|uniref:xanthine dehydrogenase family protein molybdopterin-binding subunit n=1 Tax=Bradyrhizobium guangdongense TaxID=1325090 RepID=UPI00112E4B20|nr:molybdopterin cofactor-binding domain-containing protein [Bradyrhizobium guangdongense]TPQ28848.1 xanthine dehydrogenase family protein molybdopterin-binding subunit [Bradyrhizobium guangdongense]
MSASLDQARFSRRAILKGGALTVGFALTVTPGTALAQSVAGVARRTDNTQVDAYLTVNADGTVTVYCGKVDLGQGLRIAIPQIAAEELGIGVDRIKYFEGDTALTPNQGRTAGSTGIQRGGMQIRQAAATARKGLVDLAAQRLNLKPDELTAADGEVRPKAGGAGIAFAALLEGRKFDLKLDPNAPLKDPRSYTIVGKPLPRPDVAAKCLGTATYIHDLTLPDMLHARVIRPPAIGATLVSVDEDSIKDLAGVKVVRIKDFLAVVADDEWTSVRAARSLRAQWSEASNLPDQSRLTQSLREASGAAAETLVAKGAPPSPAPQDAKALTASYFWPMQSHASLGPSCAVADVSADQATIWTASQGMHDNRVTYARFLGLPLEKVRLIYLEGSGCYGMNGHEDAAADAAILSRAVGRPVRVQWSRADELGWDPKGPPQLLDLAGSVDAEGKILDWRTEMWIPQTTKGLLNIPLLGPQAAGLDNIVGLNTGLISQNGDPPYEAAHMQVVVHWLKETPLRPAPLRSPGKPANCFAVESFMDELAAAARLDPVAFRLRGLKNTRGIELVKRVAAMMKWEPRPSPGPNVGAATALGRGISYIHYKHSETLVAMGMEVAVEQASGRIKVERVSCAHDCGQIINPDGVRSQVEGSILQTISRVLMEEVKFDRARVTSVDWAGYPILRFSDVPKIEIELVDRPSEPPLGAGEAACAAVGAALANAVFDATGLRLRTVPFTPERVKAAQSGKA